MLEIASSFSALLRQLDPSGALLEPVVFAAWRRCVEGPLADNVVPQRFEGTRLTAAVPNETWRRNVMDLGPGLAEKLNRIVGPGTVKFIEFRVDEAAVESRRRRPELISTTSDAALEGLDERLMQAANGIADDELRRQFLAAAAGSLARRDAVPVHDD